MPCIGRVVRSQSDLEQLRSESCTRINGHLRIQPTSISVPLSLEPLRGLKSVQGSLTLSTQSITTLAGLENLTSIGVDHKGASLTLLATSVKTLAAFAHLSGPLRGSLSLFDNANLESLVGLESITQVS